jgi:hypothetical protein
VISELRLHRAAQGRGRRGRVARRQLAGGAEDAEGEGEAAGQSGRSVAEGGEHAAMASAHMVGVPAKVDSDTKQVAVENTKRILVEKQMDLVRDFPYWAMNSGLADAAKGHGQNGLWRANRGPPYVQATTMFAGEGVDKQGSGNLVRRIVGLKTSFRFHKWEGNNFLTSFDGPQFRFLYRNVHSSLIIPPLEMSGGCVARHALMPVVCSQP